MVAWREGVAHCNLDVNTCPWTYEDQMPLIDSGFETDFHLLCGS